ncbi:S8 family peptidase [Georgenia sp. SUBG003]|uniref:S8 family peptidase n=1 Tax=Georgenia sp. SUBG003 TaxID=1497974 RepID=UPI0004D4289D|nr:peptidase S8 [Georgenia sp. SUBG003]
MRFTAPSRLGVTLAASAALLASTVGPAYAAPAADEPASTPVPIDIVDGTLMSYVVNLDVANPGQTRLAERAVENAGGVVVQSWPQIGVVVAHSTSAKFLDELPTGPGTPVESAGPTRTAAVSEGTPDLGRETTPGDRGAAPYKRQLRVDGLDAGDVTSAADAAEVREGGLWSLDMVHAYEAHEVSEGSDGVLVGVLDSGIDAAHPDLAPSVDASTSVGCTAAGRPDTSPEAWGVTTSGHGTHVAGTIAAARDGAGVVGVAPNVRMASVKVVNDDGYIYPEYAICGFVWAAEHGMDVTNNSYYVDPFEFWCGDQPFQAPAMEAVRRAVDYATGRGVVHAAAAGNSAYDLANKSTNASSPNDGTAVERQINSTCKDIPTELDGVVTVSALGQDGNKAGFSNFGEGVVDVSAPGAGIVSTWPGGGYARLSGTSMASPHVAGVLALLKSTHPDAGPDELVALLEEQADDTGCPADAGLCGGDATDNGFYGEGIVNALDAVTAG